MEMTIFPQLLELPWKKTNNWLLYISSSRFSLSQLLYDWEKFPKIIKWIFMSELFFPDILRKLIYINSIWGPIIKTRRETSQIQFDNAWIHFSTCHLAFSTQVKHVQVAKVHGKWALTILWV